MKVVTLNSIALKEHCRRLQNLCSGFNPELIIGIATGGAIVADNMFSDLPHVTIKSCRPSTRTKEHLNIIFSIIKYFPIKLKDYLRIREARRLTHKKPLSTTPSLSGDTIETLKKYSRILIIDDAVDSGATMSSVQDYVSAITPNAVIKTAAITVTTNAPILTPDYSLYNQGILLRFPWSKDYR